MHSIGSARVNAVVKLLAANEVQPDIIGGEMRGFNICVVTAGNDNDAIRCVSSRSVPNTRETVKTRRGGSVRDPVFCVVCPVFERVVV